MITGSISRRYARALFGLAVESGRVEAMNEALAALKKAVDTSPELGDVLQNPVYTREQRRAVLEPLSRALGLPEEAQHLVFILGDRNRLGALGSVVDEFRQLADAELGRLRARVTSAVPLDDAAASAIAEKLSAATQKKVIVERVVDPAILGGVVAQVGSLVYDGSLRAQLDDLRKTLKQ
jgi:F-type H+-transporting ATPase subunit delta